MVTLTDGITCENNDRVFLHDLEAEIGGHPPPGGVMTGDVPRRPRGWRMDLGTNSRIYNQTIHYNFNRNG
jgi:hypothetical protein